MIDLHVHTTNSDGTWTTKEMLEKAEKMGLEVFSITDHDTAKSYIEIEQNPELKEIYKGKLIQGVELNCTYNGIKIEILAYGFEVKPIQNFLENYYTPEKNKMRLIEEFNELVQLCRKNRIKIEDNLKYNPDCEYPVDVIYDSIVKCKENKKLFREKEWESKENFFRTCTIDKKFPLYRDFSKQMPTLEFFNKLIHKYNGKIFLAHLYKYKLDNHIDLLNEITKKNLIDGIEVYHSSFTKEQMKFLELYCKDNKLLMSGGSDCHGERKKDRKLGVGYDNLNISKDIIKNWNI